MTKKNKRNKKKKSTMHQDIMRRELTGVQKKYSMADKLAFMDRIRQGKFLKPMAPGRGIPGGNPFRPITIR